MYHVGKDSIHWHADNTQGEDVILSLTVNGPVAEARIICFQIATAKHITGDEQLELYPIPGDGHSTDGMVHASYMHAMLKTRPSHMATTGRMAIIVQNGINKMYNDKGSSVSSLAAPARSNQYIVGNMCENRSISYSTHRHIGMGMEILPETERLDARLSLFINGPDPVMKINFTP